MQNIKRLSLQIVSVAAVAMLFSVSAFAESRHVSATSRSGGGHISRGESRGSSGAPANRDRSFSQSNRSADRGTWSRNDAQRPATRNVDRGTFRDENSDRSFESRQNAPRVESRSRVNSRNDGWHNNNRSAQRGTVAPRSQSRVIENDARWNRFRGSNSWSGRGTPYRGQSYCGYGRVSRYERWHGGYRVWIGGGLYPIFVPFDYWYRSPLRIGLYIRFGGFWDPFGYWSIADYAAYDRYYDGYYDGYYSGSTYTRGEIRGVVESVDFRRGTMVINDDISRQFITVRMPRDRRLDDVRSGDYVEFSGDWNRSGVFDAYRLERLDYDRGGDGYRDDDRRY